MTDQHNAELTRRVVLRGATVAGVALPLLSACGGGGSDAEPEADAPEADAPEASAEPSVAAGAALATTADVPVGGGTVLTEQKIVITQPTEGDFKAFTAVCTHKQCVIKDVKDGTINCPCHGSKFSPEDGSVQGGPAPASLAAIAITVKGSEISAA